MAKQVPNLGFRKFTCPVEGVEWNAYRSKYKDVSPAVRACLETFGLGKRVTYALFSLLFQNSEKFPHVVSQKGFSGVKHFFQIIHLNPSSAELEQALAARNNGKISALMDNYWNLQYPQWLRYLFNIVASPYLIVNFFAKLAAFITVYLDEKWSELYFKYVKNIMIKKSVLAYPWNGLLRITFASIAFALGSIRLIITSAASPLHYLFFKEPHEVQSRGAAITGAFATIGTFIGLALSPGGFDSFAAPLATMVSHEMTVAIGVFVVAYISFAIGSFTNQFWEHVKGQVRAVAIEAGVKEYKDFVSDQKVFQKLKRSTTMRVIEMQPMEQQQVDNQVNNNDNDSSSESEEEEVVVVGERLVQHARNIPKSKSNFEISGSSSKSNFLPRSVSFN